MAFGGGCEAFRPAFSLKRTQVAAGEIKIGKARGARTPARRSWRCRDSGPAIAELAFQHREYVLDHGAHLAEAAVWSTALAGLVDIGYVKSTGRSVNRWDPRHQPRLYEPRHARRAEELANAWEVPGTDAGDDLLIVDRLAGSSDGLKTEPRARLIVSQSA